ncbi:phage late control D family protein [Rhizobium sp. CFBP 8762]|uniref:phage late control D family protein n=1 Tax=Rhizobium sp. CFBP 8762 TaxID=2775279 RepID=UPI00177C5F09|nr:contractile injection system protein, VgrG/Pvc8 family [Rhizobium sp. CFBP 8762]MBD8556919.1 phage late control D family protein [Rhizobium sp. CFBP 8762]
MTPVVEITVDGKPVAGAFYERLVSLTVTDKEGVGSDTFDMELFDSPEAFLAIPRKGAKVEIRLGYGQAGSLGQFTVDKVSIKCLPYSMSISGKAADLASGKLKERQERHWDGKTVKEIVDDIAAESGLTASVDPELGKHRYEWLGQQDESNVQFMRRLEQRHNALFTIKNGRLVFAKRGSGLSASGAFVGTVTITPDIISPGSCSFETNDRTRYSKVVAYSQDKDKAERVEIEAEADAEGDSVYRIPEPYADLAEADKAAQAKAKDLKRGEGSASVKVVGDTSITAGAPLLFSNVRPGLDGVPYIIETATHTFSKGGGYMTEISAKLYDGKSTDENAADDTDDAGTSASDTKGTVAKDSAKGTPYTPSQWALQRRSGRTDDN